jgi:hypothetical protein
MAHISQEFTFCSICRLSGKNGITKVQRIYEIENDDDYTFYDKVFGVSQYHKKPSIFQMKVYIKTPSILRSNKSYTIRVVICRMDRRFGNHATEIIFTAHYIDQVVMEFINWLKAE